MPDSFLQTYRVARRLYSLTGRLSVASVRDQCVRAQILAERLCVAENLRPDNTVLVLGEGISAAVVAASFAARPNGPFVVVVRQERGFANVHQACMYRVIEPYLYEWPQGHFRHTRYPLRGSATVSWDAGIAGDVATRVSRYAGKLVDAAIRAGRADVLDGCAANAFRFDPGNDKWWVRLRPVRRDGKDRLRARRGRDNLRDLGAAAVILCGGVHYERDALGDGGDGGGKFVSRRFWDVDDLMFAVAREGGRRQTPPAVRPSVLIAGGGDGALQDFVYLLTGRPDARSVMQKLALPPSPLDELAGRHAVYLRGHAASNADRDAALLRSLHDEAEWVCDTLWRDARVRARARESLLPIRSRPVVQIACRSWHFSHCYPLNRVLAGLLARAAAAHPSVPPAPVPFRMNVEIQSIASTAPAGTRLADADDWATHPVAVTFARSSAGAEVPAVLRDKFSPDGWCPGATYSDDRGSARFDRVLLRIGAPPLTEVVRACRAADHALAAYRRREKNSVFLESEAPDIRQREARHLPPFHP